ncbi:PREDICTED: uncharacterized protein LOC18611891 [Theobroma cacao]|uniref:Uncharacterized protein LOC18611891 n=1 Tax=Theobroma cacao TaxID=3641 RepID=A0AB32VME0_THECC|nr:PREDICTED: uncharacterized protein LOC18611891 [Theobroma cacao]
MLHHRREVAKNQISSFNPAYQIHSNRDGTGDIEFDFWRARKTWYYDTLSSVDGCEIEFQVQACVKERFGDCSSPLWRANKVTDASPLLPNNYFYSNLSPATRTQAIEEGRKELMEMIRNMPESSYELSLKDMVDEQHASEEVKGKAISEDENFCSETEAQTKKQKKKKRKKRKAGSISRSGSMEVDSFLIKMFFRSSLSFKKKSKAENSSKVSPSPSSEGSGKPDEKQRWLKRIFTRRNHKNRDDKSSSNSIDSSNSTTSRHANKTSLPACWLFFLFKKSKPKRQEEFII